MSVWIVTLVFTALEALNILTQAMCTDQAAGLDSASVLAARHHAACMSYEQRKHRRR
jgi:hypothetical protein